jgi:hypothetical protein
MALKEKLQVILVPFLLTGVILILTACQPIPGPTSSTPTPSGGRLAATSGRLAATAGRLAASAG